MPASSPRIRPDMTVREVIAAFPATTAVFERHGLMGCGGEEGPLEPVGFFARAHDVDVALLLAELDAAIAAPATEPVVRVAAPPPPAPSARYVPFFIASLFFALTFGALLGALALATATLPWGFLGGLTIPVARTAHAHAQVFGFAAMFIMGVAYHALPRFKSASLAAPRLATASFWLQAGGVLAIATGVLIDSRAGAAAHVLGAAALVAGAAAFAWTIHRTLAAGAPAAQRFEPYLRAGVAWLIVASALALAVAAGVPALQPAVWEAALYGFVASWIFGFSLRILPVFMGVPPSTEQGATALWAAYQTAAVAWVATAIIEAWYFVPGLRALAGAALAVTGLVFVLRLGLYGPREAPGPGVDRGYEKFVLAAYAWLLAALFFTPGWAAGAAVAGGSTSSLIADFGRHAFTLGFVTQMLIGISTRIVPVFTGATLWSPRWREATFYLLNASVAVRGLEVVVELGGPEGLWPFIALSGALGFAAFAAFALNIVMTMRAHAAAHGEAAPAFAGEPTADSIVADLLTIPGALDLLVGHGFKPLRNPVMRATMAHAVTLRQACRMHGIAVEPIVAELERLARASRAAATPHGAHAAPAHR